MSKPQALFAKYEALLPILAAVCEFERRRHASRNESEFPGLRWISDSAGCQPCQTSAPALGLKKISLSVYWPRSTISIDLIGSIELRSNQSDFYSGLLQRIQIRFRYLLVCNHFMHRCYRHDVTETAMTELTGVTNCNRPAGDFNHSPVDLRLQ